MARRVVIFGNSGSGKSTLARRLSATAGLAHLDLDTLAWRPVSPPERESLEESGKRIAAFLDAHDNWVIEGCYADLVDLTLSAATEIIFLDLPVYQCQENARNRPWEPHKYDSREAQDANLAMLLEWIAAYSSRGDTFSRAAHEALFEHYGGKKTRFTSNVDVTEAGCP